LPQQLTLTTLASGFRLIGYKLFHSNDSLVVDVVQLIRELGLPMGASVSVATRQWITDKLVYLSDPGSIVQVVPDSVRFDFGDRIHKNVPVKSNLLLSFERQYDSTSGVVVLPATIQISGPKDLMDTISFIETETVVLPHVKANVNRKLRLIHPEGVFSEVDQVEVRVPVEKFTEGETEVLLNVINEKKGYKVKTFPDKVKLRYRVSLSEYNKINAGMFDVVVDASGIDSLKSNRINVVVVKKAPYVRTVEPDPQKVEFILRKE
jgi:hypothetical protein